MIEHLGLAAVTAALQYTVQSAVTQAVNQAHVTLRRPTNNETLEGPRANIYLYQAEPCPVLRNADLPTRASTGTVRQSPVAAYDVRFLLSFYGDDARYEPQLMAGKVLEALHTEQPSLPADAIEVLDQLQPALGFGRDPDQFSSFWHQLVDAYARMRAAGMNFFQTPLAVSELSQLWSFLFHAPYTLSMAWQCSSVPLISALEPAPVPPVTRVSIRQRELPPPRPVLERLVPADATAGTILRLSGRGLDAGALTVKIGSAEAGIVAQTSEMLDVRVPAELSAGTLPVVLEYTDGHGRLHKSNPMAVRLHERENRT
ncbi:Pvc16 family protein [Haliangium sp.]|uniref:Pvc16 family protein n=1 Tax=Haliangium sp. TaxID=2663208 RepID=UPI003D09BFEE